ncbi:MAG: hypothetical protein AAF581_13740 [Planctomycetota bacterium]
MSRKTFALLSCFAFLSAAAFAQQGPDVIVGELTGPGNYGNAGGYHAYSVGTTSCNQGDQTLQWIAGTNEHPVIAQHLYRLKDGKFEQIGISWLKHGFTALQGNACALGCTPSGSGSFLGIGCSDPYGAGLNASQGNGPRSEINATTGIFPYPYVLDPPVTDTTSRRIRVPSADVDPAQNAGALYFLEGQYVAPDDAAALNHHNNASYRQVQVANGSFALSFTGPTVRELPAIEAWGAADPTVVIENLYVDGGRFLLGTKVTDLGSGFWQYEYALQNLNSDRSAGAFTIPVPSGVVAQSIGFHDVEYHSGEPYSGTDWVATQNTNDISWATEPHATNVNANALRWGTLYNFRFVASSAPVSALATVGLFKPGTPTTAVVPTLAPVGGGGSTPPITGLSCTVNQLDAVLSWTNAGAYDSVLVFRNGQQVATLAGTDTTYTDAGLPLGQQTYLINGVISAIPSSGVGCTVDILPPQPIIGLSCSANGFQGVLTWTNPQPYDFIEVRRNGFPLTTLLGTATQFDDIGLNVGSFDYQLTPGVGAINATPEGCSITVTPPPALAFSYTAQSQSVSYNPADGVASFTTVLNVQENATNPGYPNDVSGLSVALAHDPAYLDATSIDLAPPLLAANGGAGPDFVASFLHPDGVTLGTVFAFDLSWSMQATATVDIVTVDYDTVGATLAGNATGATTTLTYVDNVIGTPPVENSVVSGIGNNTPTYTDAVVTLAAATTGGFIRGDGDGDGAVNITDAIYALGYLFNSGPGLCVKALDYNDDGGVNLVDPVGVLAYLFTQGTAPAQPFPNCGPDTTGDTLPCGAVPACP